MPVLQKFSASSFAGCLRQSNAVARQGCAVPAKLRPIAALVLAFCAGVASLACKQAHAAGAASGALNAQSLAQQSLVLRPSPWLEENISALQGRQAASVIWGDRLDGEIDRQVTVTGQAELRHPAHILKSDVLRYDQSTNIVTASGKVLVNRQGDVFRGERLQLQMDSYEGSFDNVNYEILRTGGQGTASKVDFLDRDHSVISDGIYSTCKPEPGQTDANWKPDWYIRGKKIILDTEQDQGYVEDGALVFGGVPVIPVPSFAFPLSDKRRSGFLPPAMSFSSASGAQYSQPYYFNIAPNRDATVATNISSKRGLDLYGQFRYLEDNYRGQLDLNVMPRDRLTSTKRWNYHLDHTQSWPHSTTGFGNFVFSLDLNRVSDNTYWRDFQSVKGMRNTSGQISPRLLANTATLNWNYADWSAFVTAQRWQTQQLPAPDNITPPFDKMPQVHLRYARNNVRGFDVALDMDSTHFKSDAQLTGQPNGTRSYMQGKVSYPWIGSWGFLTPGLELNATHYQTSTPMADGRRSASRVLPTLTLDGGLVFERKASLFGRSLTQTLEPRLLYVYTPYKKQDALPLYDTAVKDFNLASIFSSNPFTGADRFSNNSTITAGLTSRLYDATDGAELARLTVAQRHRFTPRRVFLNALDSKDNQSMSNILLDGAIRWNPHWSAETSLDYDQRTNKAVSARLGVRYAPRPYRVVTANISRQTGGNEQLDVGWQWPLNDLWGDKGKTLPAGQGEGAGRWYMLGRVYYSLTNRRVTEALAGLEYDSCCWIARVAVRSQQTQTLPVRMNHSVMLQLEFNGLARIGTGALQLFRDNVPGYTPLREAQLTQPSRFGRYD